MAKIFSFVNNCACSVVNSRLVTTSCARNLCYLNLKTVALANPRPILSLRGEKWSENTEEKNVCQFHTQTVMCDRRGKTDRRNIKSTVAEKDEGTDGLGAASFEDFRGFGTLFPDENTPNQLYDNVKFIDLPIVNVMVSRNNTKFLIADAKGKSLLGRTCGMDGFKHAQKGTNVAAQVTAESLAKQAAYRGVRNVKVAIRGLGPGRAACLKGLVNGGLNVVCISDVTPISFYYAPRPRKAKKS